MDAVEADHRIRVARETAQAKIDAATEIARRKDLAAAERQIQGKQRTTLRWAIPTPHINVTDEAAPHCPSMMVRRSGGGGVILIIHPAGGITLAPRYLVNGLPESAQEPWFSAWAWDVAQRINATRQSHRGLETVHNISVWRDIFSDLCDSETYQVGWDGKYSRGVRDDLLITVPTINAIRIAPDGLRIRVRPHRAADPARWSKAAPDLTAALRRHGFTVGDLTVTAHPCGDLILALNDTPGSVPEPAVVKAPAGITPYDAENHRSYIGVEVDSGEPVYAVWANHAGFLVGGTTGGGKTGSTMPIIAGLAGQGEIHLFDGKGGFDYFEFKDVATTYDASGDVAAPLETLRNLAELIPVRAEAIFKATGKRDFWKLTPAECAKHQLYPIVVVMDEAHTWLDQSGMDAAEKKAAVEIARHVRTLVLKGRSGGYTTILTTQKSDATAMPTRIRDNCTNRMAFRTTTPEHARTILGATADGAPDPCSISPKTPGRCIVVVNDGASLVQAGYADEKEIAAFLMGKTPPPDQRTIAWRLAGGKEPT